MNREDPAWEGQHQPSVWWLLVALLVCLLAGAALFGQEPRARHAVVRITLQDAGGKTIVGGSGTVIASQPGRSLVLSCAHLFEGGYRGRPISIDAPDPDIVQPASKGGQPNRVGVRLVDVDYRVDLSLIEIGAELPYVCPVASYGNFHGRQVLSAGYDALGLPPQMRAATIVGQDAERWYTRERPAQGRSGGGLIDEQTGTLIGVVQGYELGGQRRGIYAGHAAVLAFLKRNGLGPDVQTPAPRPLPIARRQCPT